MNLAIVDPADSRHIRKISGGYDIEQIIRTVAGSGIQKVFYAVDACRKDVIKHLREKEFSIPVKIIPVTINTILDGISAVIPLLGEESVCFVATDMMPGNNELRGFIKYSEIEENADGIISVVRNKDNKNPLSVALNEEDIIIRFSDFSEGYGWAAGGLYYFSADVLSEIHDCLRERNYDVRIVLKYIIKQGYRLVGLALPLSNSK